MSYLLIRGDARRIPLADRSVQCVVTSPPYWGLRDYQEPGQIGLEPTADTYVAALVEVFREVRRVMRNDATLWLNLGDTYNGNVGGAGPGSKISRTRVTCRPRFASGVGLREPALKPKDLIGLPWRVALALQADDWYLRADVIWSKPSWMPDKRLDRPARSHEYLFLLTKSRTYRYDADRARRHVPSKGKNLASVWSFQPVCTGGPHSARMPDRLAATCILVGCPRGGVVFDPFGGSMTTVRVAEVLDRVGIATELDAKFIALGRRQINRPHAPRHRPERAESLPLFPV